MPHRTATSIHVRLGPDMVNAALREPGFLEALDERLEGATVDQDDTNLLVRASSGVTWDVQVAAEGNGSRIIIGASDGGESTMEGLFRPGSQVERLEEDAARLRSMLDAMQLFQR